jgi:hypothetical protein
VRQRRRNKRTSLETHTSDIIFLVTKIKDSSFKKHKINGLYPKRELLDPRYHHHRQLYRAPSSFVHNSYAFMHKTWRCKLYKNSQNVRRFFTQHCGAQFHFSIPLMHFMKTNCGKTLQDAINEWQRLNHQAKDKNFKSDIPAGNQYNQYLRDFFADTPGMSIKEARHFWELKRCLWAGMCMNHQT